MSCLCESCSSTPALTYTRQHRMACEARSVLSMPSHARRPFLEEAEKKRGKESVDALKEEIDRQFKRG